MIGAKYFTETVLILVLKTPFKGQLSLLNYFGDDTFFYERITYEYNI